MNDIRRLNRTHLRVLGAVLRLHAVGRPITHRAIQQEIGWHGMGQIVVCLRTLRKAGLVSYESRKVGTIRPTCRLERVCPQPTIPPPILT